MTLCRAMKKRPSIRRRGMAYIAVLMISMLVAIASLSGLSVARSRLRAVETASHTTRARFYAESAIEMALHTIGADSNWRNTYTHNEWTAERVVGNGGYAWKLVDESDGNLANDSEDPVRLYGKGVVENAMRIYSVELKPRPVANLLDNTEFKVGTRGWDSLESCNLTVSSTSPYSGPTCLWVNSRADPSAGVHQDITSKITNGTSYYVEVWRGGLGLTNRIEIILETTDGTQTTALNVSPPGLGWRKASGVLTPTWTGTLKKAYWKFYAPLAAIDFWIDDILMVEGTQPPQAATMVPVPGTWRREAGA